ncbi:hypothetical protein [Marinicella sp. W31]|uniref:hypothetical protein n=1 Tax=Marinicella sp. W31 TaxID=3023713 RepID=UPI0037568C45
MKTCIFTLLLISQTYASADDTLISIDTDEQTQGQHTIIYSDKLRKKRQEVDTSILVLDTIVVRPEYMPEETPEAIQQEIVKIDEKDDQ